METSAYKSIIEKIESIERKFNEIGAKGQSQSLERLWLDGKEVCKILRITSRTLHNYRKRDILPFSQVGVKVLYKVADIQKILEERYVTKSG